jgi:hypothetical protein
VSKKQQSDMPHQKLDEEGNDIPPIWILLFSLAFYGCLFLGIYLMFVK